MGIVSDIFEFPEKSIFSANQVRVASHFYDNKPCKIGGKKILVTIDSRESRTFISDLLSYLPVRFPTNKQIQSCTKVLLTPSGQWKPSDLENDGQWEDSDDDVSFRANIYAIKFTQSNDVLEFILSAPQYKAPNATFAYDVAFTNGATDNEVFY